MSKFIANPYVRRLAVGVDGGDYGSLGRPRQPKVQSKARFTTKPTIKPRFSTKPR